MLIRLNIQVILQSVIQNMHRLVLELWKDYDNNAFDNHKDVFADSVVNGFILTESSINGPRDSIIASAKAYRSSLKNAVSSVEVVTTLKPKGKDETWVCVWGKEVDTHKMVKWILFI